MQWVMKKRSYWKFGELLNPGVKTLIYATDPQGCYLLLEVARGAYFHERDVFVAMKYSSICTNLRLCMCTGCSLIV